MPHGFVCIIVTYAHTHDMYLSAAQTHLGVVDKANIIGVNIIWLGRGDSDRTSMGDC